MYHVVLEHRFPGQVVLQVVHSGAQRDVIANSLREQLVPPCRPLGHPSGITGQEVRCHANAGVKSDLDFQAEVHEVIKRGALAFFGVVGVSRGLEEGGCRTQAG